MTTSDEIKCLEVMETLNEEHPIDIVPTFLGAHAIPPEYKDLEEQTSRGTGSHFSKPSAFCL